MNHSIYSYILTNSDGEIVAYRNDNGSLKLHQGLALQRELSSQGTTNVIAIDKDTYDDINEEGYSRALFYHFATRFDVH